MLSLPVHQNDHQLGPIDAPVQLVEYGNFTCRRCQTVYPIINQIQHWFGDHLCFVFRHFPDSDMGSWAWQVAELAEAAGAQRQFWQVYHYLFEYPPKLWRDALTPATSTSLGLDPQQLVQDIEQHRYQQQVQEDILTGLCSNVCQTPTLFINGVQYQGGWQLDDLMETIEAAGFEQEQRRWQPTAQCFTVMPTNYLCKPLKTQEIDMKFEDYKDKYENLRMERTDSGILTVTMHTNGDSHIMTGKSHREFPNAFGDIASDNGNEIVILTGAGENWITEIDFSTVDDITKPEGWYKILFETRRVLYNLCDISVPVIAAVNGPAPIHGEYALLADVILASETTYFQDNQHLPVGGGVVPGDGVQVIYPEVLGRIRGHYFLLTMQKISAQEALNIGMVNEVLLPNQLLQRAQELAEQLLKIAPMTRRYTRLMMTKKMKQLINENVPYDMGLEGLSIVASMGQ